MNKFIEKLERAVIRLKVNLQPTPPEVAYSEDDILNAGVTRDFKSEKEERDITRIRKDRQKKALIDARIRLHKASTPKNKYSK